MNISSADRRNINAAVVAMMQNDYRVGPSVKANRELAQITEKQNPTEFIAAAKADVILDLKEQIEVRIARQRGPALDPQITNVLTEYIHPHLYQPGGSSARGQSFESAAGPSRAPAANPPPYLSGLTQDSATLEIPSGPASRRSDVLAEPETAHTALDVTSRYQPSEKARALIALYEANRGSFGEMSGRMCRLLVQDPFKESAEQISQSWDALFVTAHIGLDQRSGAGIVLRFFSKKLDYEISSIAQMQRVIAAHPFEFMDPPNLSGSMDSMLFEYMRLDIPGARPVDPLSLYMICDGVDNDLPLTIFTDAIETFKEKGQGSKQWGIQAIRVGDKKEGADTLKELDDSPTLSRDQFDTIDFSTVQSLQLLQKMMMGGFNRRYDKQK